MTFGLTNAPATFQGFMDEIYREMILTDEISIYMDDIGIFTETEEEHWRILFKVLQIAKKHDLFFKLSKCKIM